MSPLDTNVIQEMQLADGAALCSCLNGGGVPYIFIDKADGIEEGSLSVTDGYTKGERCLQALFHHYRNWAASNADKMTQKIIEDFGTAIYNHFGERGLTNLYGDQFPAQFSPSNYPDYQETEKIIFPGKYRVEEGEGNVVHIGFSRV